MRPLFLPRLVRIYPNLLFWKRIAAVAGIVTLVFTASAPALADTTTITDSDIHADQPVQQQQADLGANPGATLTKDVQQDAVPNSAAANTPQTAPVASENLSAPATSPSSTNATNNNSPDNSSAAPSLNPDTSTTAEAPCVTAPVITAPTDTSVTSANTAADGTPAATQGNADAATPSSANIDTGSNDPVPSATTTNPANAVPATGSSVGSTAPCVGSGTTTTDNSHTTTTDTKTAELEIINTNDIKVTNEVKADANSGKNEAIAPHNIRHANMDTGDVNVYANVLTVANTNLVNSKIVEITQNFNELSDSLSLNQQEKDPAETAQDLVTGICSNAAAGETSDNSTNDVKCESFSAFKLTNKNNADVNNDVSLNGNSGQNTLSAGHNLASSNITTGKVNAVVNVLNFVNNNLVNSRLTVVNFNIFGDWKGDLVMPSELYFENAMTVGNNSASDVSLIKKVVFNVNNDNGATINNNVTDDAKSGDNKVTNNGSDGVVRDSGADTGSTESGSNVQNVANTNIINGKWYLGLVNTLGHWSGNVYSLPEQVAVAPTKTGLSFFSTTASDKNGSYAMFADAVDNANQSVSEEDTVVVDINNQNTATINNNVDIGSNTGSNTIEAGNDIRHAQIVSGNARALANILNFVNTNLVNADVQVGMVNIFGNWDGSIVFGYPDLAVSQSFLGDTIPGTANQPLSYQFNYSNLGDGSIADTVLEWHYDREHLAIKDTAGKAYTEVDPGIVKFDLGKLMPQASSSFKVDLLTSKDLVKNALADSYLRIFGSGPEQNNSNNESIIHTALGAASAPAAGPANNGGTANSNTGGGGGSFVPASPPSPSSNTSLAISKVNDRQGQTLQTGDIIKFVVSVDNHTNTPLSNTLVYDTLRGPDGSIVYSKTFPLDNLGVNAGADITYELQINASALGGQYTNSAYVESLNNALQPVRSVNTATSLFTIGGSVQSAQQAQPQDPTKKNDDSNQKPFVELTPNQSDQQPLSQNTPTQVQEKVLGDQTASLSGYEGKLVKFGQDPTVYYVESGKLRPITYNVFMLRKYKFSNVKTIPGSVPQNMVTQLLAPPEGTLVREQNNPTVYVVAQGVLHPMNRTYYLRKRLNRLPIRVMSAGDVAGMPKGSPYLN